MDYDTTAIATTYDAARSYAPEVLRLWLDLVAVHAPSTCELVIDVGCGTGRFTVPLAERLKARVIGIDPSERMLEVAGRKMVAGRVEFRQGRGERLPVDDGVADLVFLSMVLHHLDDPAGTAKECRRVLRDGGRVCARNSTRETEYVQRRFFPGIVPIIEAELPSREEVIELFEATGFKHPRTSLCRTRWPRTGMSLPTNWPCARTLSSRACRMPISRPASQRCAPTRQAGPCTSRSPSKSICSGSSADTKVSDPEV